MKTLNSLLRVGLPLALLAFLPGAHAASDVRPALPKLDCETLQDQDYSTMDLYALQERWNACFRTIKVAHEAKPGCPMHQEASARAADDTRD